MFIGNKNKENLNISIIPPFKIVPLGTHLHYWWECKLVQPLWRTVGSLLKKAKNRATIWSTIPLLGIYPEKMITLIQKDTCILIFIKALFTMAETWKQPKYPLIDEYIKKMWYTHTHKMCFKKCFEKDTHTHTHTHDGLLYSH